MRKLKKGYKKPKVEVVEFDKDLYKKNLEETEQITNDPGGAYQWSKKTMKP